MKLTWLCLWATVRGGPVTSVVGDTWFWVGTSSFWSSSESSSLPSNKFCPGWKTGWAPSASFSVSWTAVCLRVRTAFEYLNWTMALCSPRKYPYPLHQQRFYGSNFPPPWNFQFSFIFFFKNFGFWDPFPPRNFQWPSLGVGMDIFWNRTIIKDKHAYSLLPINLVQLKAQTSLWGYLICHKNIKA